jgi:exosortase/archaeosortase family protein
MEALFLLSAAIAVVPLSWSQRSRGLLLGTLIVFVANQARILALFYAYRADHNLFDRIHGIIAPIAVILVVTGYFHAWLLHASSRATSAV